VTDCFRGLERFERIGYSVLLLPVIGFFGYYGMRGALLYAGGSRTAPAEPFAWGIGLGVALGASYVALHLLRGASTRLPQLFLLISGLGALAGAVWFVLLSQDLGEPWSEVLKTVVMLGGVGTMALILWWRRVHDHG